MEEWKLYKIAKRNSSYNSYMPYKKNDKLYVSNYGNIKINDKIVKPYKTKGSPQYYKIFGSGVHKLVAKLFIPNPEKKPCVEHINANSLDNRVENLRWATVKENNNNPITRQRYSFTMKVFKQQRKPLSEEHKQKFCYCNKGKTPSTETRQKIGIKNYGKKRSEEFKKMRQIKYQIKASNGELDHFIRSSIDTIWMYKYNEKPKQIKKEEVDKYLAQGWKKGRGKQWVTKNNTNKLISHLEINTYLEQGWKKGRTLTK